MFPTQITIAAPLKMRYRTYAKDSCFPAFDSKMVNISKQVSLRSGLSIEISYVTKRKKSYKKGNKMPIVKPILWEITEPLSTQMEVTFKGLTVLLSRVTLICMSIYRRFRSLRYIITS